MNVQQSIHHDYWLLKQEDEDDNDNDNDDSGSDLDCDSGNSDFMLSRSEGLRQYLASVNRRMK